MTFPTVHLNGTSKKDLIEQYQHAKDAVLAASAALRQAWPNGRDYYPQGPSAAQKAMDEHGERLSKLADVRREIEDILEHLSK